MLARPAAYKLARGSVVLIASLSYLTFVFQFLDPSARAAGLGDWQDPYFINGLMEHWYRTATSLTDPSSPPMYFPVRRTLGYSHGLVLYAPFYVPLRAFLHPFHAYTLMLFLVMVTGVLCLFALLRKMRLSFVEALVLSAVCFSSPNVVHGETGVWSQRASVFLIPPILLLLLASKRMPPGRAAVPLAAFAGFVAALLYVQDFYTAHFALLVAGILGGTLALMELRPREWVEKHWRGQPRASRVALAIAAGAAAWAVAVVASGGAELDVGGFRIRSHDWRRPSIVAVVALIVFLRLSGSARGVIRSFRAKPWLSSVLLGVLAGAGVFLWMYLGAYHEHRAFPEQNLLSSLVVVDSWDRLAASMRGHDGYRAFRSFLLAFVVGAVACIPRLNRDRKTRVVGIVFLVVSLVVLLIPLKLGAFSVWNAVLRPLPGFGVIRDPKRVIQVYELAVALVTALVVAQLPGGSRCRTGIVLLAFVLAAMGNPERFVYERPIASFERRVAAPIDIDPACRTFYIRGPSRQYGTGSSSTWSPYNLDSLFIALDQGIPTMNGFSAWSPRGWNLHNPEESLYPEYVRRWIEMNGLRQVCELDIDARTMTLRSAAR